MLDEVICPKCGTTNPSGTSWCLNDGAFLWPDEEPDLPDVRLASDIDAAGPPEVIVEPDRPVIASSIRRDADGAGAKPVRGSESYRIDLADLPAWLTGPPTK